MTALVEQLTPPPVLQFFDSNGDPLSGGLLFTYLAGTTTKANTYSDDTGGTTLPNPIVLNSRGEPKTGSGTTTGVWIPPGTAYKFVLAPSTDTDPPTNPIWTVNNVTAPNLGTLLTVGASGTAIVSNGTSWVAGYPAMRGYIAGLTLSNDSITPNSILDISAGQATDSTGAVLMTLASAFTKSTGGTWVAGTGQNGMGTGLTIANSTWYHVFEIVNNGAVDIYFDTSVTAANKPTNTTAFRRIGSFKTNGSAQIITFLQDGDYFQWGTIPAVDVSVTNPGTSAQTGTLSVPTGVNVISQALWTLSNAGAGGFTSLLVTDLATADVTAASGRAHISGVLSAAAGAQTGSAEVLCRTSTSGQVRWRLVFSDANVSVNAYTRGWFDSRGRFA